MDTALSVAVDTLAVRLADEGVPQMAISRATRVPSDDLREFLLDAQAEGRLQQLPPADWPVGYPKDQRALQLSRMVEKHRDVLQLLVRQVFALSPGYSRALIKLLEHEHVGRASLHIALSRTSDPVSDAKIVDVAICEMRKHLRPFGIVISTIWGFGYCLSAENRRKATDLIFARVAATPAL